MDGAKYTKNTESVEIYANPNENPYSAPDIAQHYETVSYFVSNLTLTLSFSLTSQCSQVEQLKNGEFMFQLWYKQ